MMVGVFQMHDMEPGPLVFLNSADLVWVVFAAMFFANLSILLIGFLETKTIINLLRIPFQFLAPLILMLATVGAYAVRGLVIDVVVMFVAGVAGFFLRRTGYSVAGIVLGADLGKNRRADLRPSYADAALRVGLVTSAGLSAWLS